jgi:hypothetical protein
VITALPDIDQGLGLSYPGRPLLTDLCVEV